MGKIWTFVIIFLFCEANDIVPGPTFSPSIPPSCSSTEVKAGFQTRIKKIAKPPTKHGKPLHVYVGFFVESIGNVRETDMSFQLDIYMYQNWKDKRERHNDTLRIIDDQKSLNDLWLPDLYFANAKSALFQTVTVPNFVIYIYPDGTIAYSARITMSLACNLDLKEYPLDTQTCSVKLLSYGLTTEQMKVEWFSDRPVEFDPSINLPEFQILGMKNEYCTGTYNYGITEHEVMREGNFSCLIAHIYLDREMGYHLVQTYIPTGMIIIISWVSFWIDPNAVPARVSLSFTTLLTLATQGTGLRYSLPPVSYAKAIDYWYGTCLLFLFAALIEFAVVNTLMRKAKRFQDVAIENCAKKSRCLAGNQDSDLTGQLGVGDAMEFILLQKRFDNHHMKRALEIDKMCRFVFPSSFGVFLVTYWLYYKVL